MSKNRFTNKRVLVTGGTGFLGSHVVEELLAQGATVATLSRGRLSPWRLAHLLDNPELNLSQCDLLDSEGTLQAITRFAPDILFHFASEPDKSESALQAHAVVAGNVTATLNVLEAFRQSKGELFVFVDSAKAYGNAPVPHSETTPVEPNCSYAITKVAAWNFCELYQKIHGVSSVCIRPTLVFGPRQGFNLINYVVNTVSSGERELILMGGDQTRDPIFIGDAVEAFLAAAERPQQVAGKIINISGGVERSVREIAQAVIDSMQTDTQISCDDSQARLTEIWRSYCDITAAKELLGWEPLVPFADGVAQTIEYILDNNDNYASASA